MGCFWAGVLARDFVRYDCNYVYEVTFVDLSIEVNATGAVILVCPNNTVVAGWLSFTSREQKTGTVWIEVAFWAKKLNATHLSSAWHRTEHSCQVVLRCISIRVPSDISHFKLSTKQVVLWSATTAWSTIVQMRRSSLKIASWEAIADYRLSDLPCTYMWGGCS